MAIPLGTTSRQLSTIARWTLAAAVIAGMLSWWWPTATGWGALAGCMLVVFVLWLAWKTTAGDRTVPGNIFHVVLLGPLAIWIGHFVRRGFATGAQEHAGLAGALDISAAFQAMLLALGVMLTQSLMARRVGRNAIVMTCGAAMVGGALAALTWGVAAPVRSAMAFLAFAGLGLWFSVVWPAWRPAAASDPPSGPHSLRLPRLIGVGVGAAACVLLVIAAPREAVLGAGVLVVILLVGAAVFRGGKLFIVAFALFTAVAGALVWVTKPTVGYLLVSCRSPFGCGERAFDTLVAGNNGLKILGMSIGWVGLAWLSVGLVVCALWLLAAQSSARGQTSPNAAHGVWGLDSLRMILRVWAAAMTASAMLAPGGLFIPAVTLAVAFAWGLAQATSGRAGRAYGGYLLLAALAVMVMLLGLARDMGLVGWSARAFALDDRFLHVMAGFLLAMTLAWQLGARRVWGGLLGVVLALAVGAGGEVMQFVASSRNASWTDVACHCFGSLAAVPLYLLCIGARLCEWSEPQLAARAR
ncbi:MAG TPA: hypothetical protein VNA25_20410 [Phycisphaerae bacterium]|nr:hypothetical protein [Phycisphaerae bacterium]